MAGLCQAQAQKILGGEMYWRGDKSPLNGKAFSDTLELILYTKNVTLESDSEKVYIYSKTSGRNLKTLVLYKTKTLYQLKNDNSTCTAKNGIKVFKQSFLGILEYGPVVIFDEKGTEIVFDRYVRDPELQNINLAGDVAFSIMTTVKPFESIDNLSPSLQPKATEKFMVCQGKTFTLDANTYNQDGYRLSYNIITPIAGITKKNAKEGAKIYFKTPTKYTTWKGGYSLSKPFGNNSSLKIDSKSGIISGFSKEKGIYGFSIKIEQYDAYGQAKGFTIKDMFIQVTDCPTNNNSSLLKPTIKENNVVVQNLLICPGETRTLSVPFDANVNYQWKKNNAALGEEISEKLKISEAGNYSVVLSSSSDCSQPVESDSVSLRLKFTKPEINIGGNGVKTVWQCEGNELKASLKENPDNFEIEWVLVNGPSETVISNDKELKLVFGGYVKAKFKNTGCAIEPFSKQVTVERYSGKPQFPIAVWPKDTTFIICAESRGILFKYDPNYDYPNFTLYHNDKPKKTEIGIFPIEPGKYYYVYGNPGCLDTTNTFYTKYVPDCFLSKKPIITPNIFTPNGDGINDTFEIFSLNEYQDFFNVTNFPDVELLIYDRWGKMVFYDKGQNKQFDGFYNGLPLPNGQYAFKIKYNDGMLKDKLGSFEIRR